MIIRGLSLVFVFYMLITIISSLAYSYQVNTFSGKELKSITFSWNGNARGVNLISPLDLAVPDSKLPGSSSQICANVTSSRGYNVVSIFEGKMVCCSLSSDTRYHIPFKEIGDERYYLCGAWPRTEIVHQPIKSAALFTAPILTNK